MRSPISKSIILMVSLVTSSSTTMTTLAFTSLTSSTSRRGQHGRKIAILAATVDDNSQHHHHQQQPSSLSSSSSSASSSQEEQEFRELDLLPNEKSSDLVSTSVVKFNLQHSIQQPHHHPSHEKEEPRSSEFRNLEPLSPSAIRRTRLEVEERTKSTYLLSGTDPYWKLQEEIHQLEQDLQSAMEVGVSDTAIRAIQGLLRRARSKDPEHVYKIALGAARSADMLGREEASRTYREESSRARQMLPQFNLEGLWVGKYGSHGFEMINVTYSGDRLIAYKVTGDRNIPRGEITFTADLSPFLDELPGQSKLDPIILSESSAKKWGTTRLPRFRGQGHAAEPGFVNHQFMEGQLVVIGGGDFFSFAWVPLEHQIFFGRPSPELILKMLREGGGSSLTAGVGLVVPDLNAGMKEQREYVSRCLEVTCDTLWEESIEGRVDPMSCIWHGDDEEYCYFE